MARSPTRRNVMAAPAVLSLSAATGACGACGAETVGRPAGSVMVAYFSRSGNTRVVAGQLHRAMRANLFEILPAQAYPEDYLETVEKARIERDQGLEPALSAEVPDIARYDTIYLGFPIWGETAPPIMRSFLTAHDLSGKALRPFITHGGYGVGDSLKVLAAHAPKATIAPPFVMEADQERRTMNLVDAWLGAAGG